LTRQADGAGAVGGTSRGNAAATPEMRDAT